MNPTLGQTLSPTLRDKIRTQILALHEANPVWTWRDIKRVIEIVDES